MDGIILVNKPKGYTSHDLVQKVRGILKIQKIGHTGTLDPMAEGLMMLTVAKATKILPYISIHDKKYHAELTLGIKTDTLDAEGTVLEEREVPAYSDEQISEVLNSFRGTYLQMPPMYSAKKVNGKKLYELARKNVEIEREPVEVTIHDIKMVSHEGSRITFDVACSSGTYIRSLCADIAERLGTVGIMSDLKRTAIDKYSLDQSYSIEQIEKGEFEMIDTYDVLYHYPYVEVADITDVMNGKPISIDTDYSFVFITHEGKVIASYERYHDDVFICKRGLW
ncbi:MAG: tRNA pseudouridine(55) synthase TruB [Erysipelotrichaceae bacterium]|nr:tRNA pseudouridine(55) synthase TruB [Erysipelotrichaceae bacterium]